MSRTGKKPIPAVSGVTVSINDRIVTAKGPKGEPWIRIAKQDEAGFVNYLMLEATSLEPKLMQWLAPFEDGSQHTIDTWFGDIREDSRAGRIPHTWRSYEGNKLREELRIKGLSWNRGLSDSEFVVPNG